MHEDDRAGQDERIRIGKVHPEEGPVPYDKRGEGTQSLQPGRTPYKAVELVGGNKKQSGCRDHKKESNAAFAKGTVQSGIAQSKQNKSQKTGTDTMPRYSAPANAVFSVMPARAPSRA
jgi:hypothetical protein